MPVPRDRVGLAVIVALLAGASALADDGAKQAGSIHDDFESARPAWRREATDASIRLLAHDRTNRAAHDGRLSEHFRFEAGPGSEFYYSYALPKVPVTSATGVSLYVRSNRAGVQLKGRVVLPSDKDPETGEPSFVLVQGPVYENSDRWQRLQLQDVLHEAERQARILRAATRRPVVLDGAYLDRLVVNLYGGPGQTEVFLDDLTVAPVPAALVDAGVTPAVPEPSLPRPGGERPEPRSDAPFRLVRNRLTREGRDWVFTAIHAPGADVDVLRRVGFDVLADDLHANPKRAERAVAAGMLLMPLLGGKTGIDLSDPARVAAEAESYPYRQAVAFWHLGGGLGREPSLKDRLDEVERARRAIGAIHGLRGDFSRLVTADVEGETARYARVPLNLDVLGIRPITWAGAQQPYETLAYLQQRRLLASRENAEELFWAWIRAAAPPDVLKAIWGTGKVPEWGHPRVQPEHLRLYTYLALAAGYRGIGFTSDADITSNAGQALLMEMALLNEEIDLFEPVIAAGSDPYPTYEGFLPDPPMLPSPGSRVNQRIIPKPEMTPHPSIRATAIGTRDRKGVLLLVYDLSNFSQFQPPQMAEPNVWLTVIAPEGAQAFEFNPGGRRVLDSQKVPGGRRIKLTDFSTSSLILMTTDFALADEIEARLNQRRSLAVKLAIQQADFRLEWAKEVNAQLERGGHPGKDAADLLVGAGKLIDDAREALEREDYLRAWKEARRSGAALRVLMRDHWDKAMEALVKATRFEEKPPDGAKPVPLRVPATSSPAAVAFNTLPQHYRLLEWLQDKSFSQNLVAGGDFDDPEALSGRWSPRNYEFDGLSGKLFLTASGTYQKKGRAIRMTVELTDPKNGENSVPPYIDFPVAAVQSPAIPVTAEYLYRISVLVKKPVRSVPGMGGVVIRDSIGGEALQFRTSEPLPEWTRVVIYRRAPEDGELTVTLGLAGRGEALFDDFRVERVEDLPKPGTPGVAARPVERQPVSR